MNKQEIIKWSRRMGISILATSIILLIVVLGLYTYADIYMPYKGNCLYKEGLINPDKANSIAQELHDNWEYKVDKEQIEEILHNAALKGNIKSMLILGHYHSEGFHSYWESNNHDKEKAAYWYLQAANKGNAEAQGELGLCYKYGKGVKQDFSKSLYWLNEGAKNGNTKAQYELGRIYQYGLALYDSYEYCFKGPYSNDYNYTNLIYEGGLIFIARGGRKYKAKEQFLEDILRDPYNTLVSPNNVKAQYYYKLSARHGLQEAKDALERVYN